MTVLILSQPITECIPLTVDVDKSQRLVLSSRNKSYISAIRDQSRDSVIARSRVTEALHNTIVVEIRSSRTEDAS